MRSCARVIFILFSFSLACHSVALATEDPKLREILHKHWEAMGGMANWNKVESIRLNGTVERDGKTVDICIVKKRPNQIRATVTIPLPGTDDEKLQVIRAHDGKTAWTATRTAGAPEMKKEELPPEAAAELLADAGVLPPLIKLWREGAQLGLVEPLDSEEESYIKILAKSSDGNAYIFYLDSETSKLIRYQTKTGEDPRTTVLSNYIVQSDISVALDSVIQSEQTGRTVMKIESVEVGIGIYGEYFESDSSEFTRNQ